MTEDTTGQRLPVLAALTATVLWSAGNVLVKASTLPGPQLAFWRTFCGASIYSTVFIARGGRLRLSAFRSSWAGGLGFGLQASLYFTALRMTSLTSAAVIASLQPLMLVPISARLFGDRLDRSKLVLMAVALSGTLIVVASSSSGGEWSLWGDLLALLATAVGCLYFLGTKSARRTLDTLEYQAHALWIAASCALPGAALLGEGWILPSGGQIFWPLVMTAIPGTGHLLMTWAQRHLTVGFTSTIALDVAVLTAIGGVVFFGQEISSVQLVGMAIVLGALAMFVRGSSERVDPVAEEM